ncbi:MAG: response regulator [Desulfobacterales bacterium]|nr:response regulator [Desulfobacterales bacterium]MDD4070995.1 response regulator [Desulfobacterales bacterium]MDD4391908.1 response regulator [Desulfobacterales bacterium]
MKKNRILIVDDSSTVRLGLKRLLSPLNAEIQEAVDGQAAFECAVNGEFELIITDYEMPGMNGCDLCSRLKSHPQTHAVPVIMLSSFDTDAHVSDGYNAGAAAYVSKNDAWHSLNSIAEDVLSRFNTRKRQRIMVVDDSFCIRKIMSNGLARAGYQVLSAQNGKDALNKIAEQRPDLILSDIDMPEMNGLDFCEAIHQNPQWADIPFVAVSACSDRAHMKRMTQYGATAYMVKPINMDQLLILIEKLLSDHFLLLLKEKERLDMERNLMLASITSLISALEARDQYTKGHSESVAAIVSEMVSLSGADKKEIEAATIGARLHDIGKIGVRDNVLLKPGRLEGEEFEHVKQHSVIGANILKSIPSLSDIIPIVLSHHERIDGKGYPHGIKGGSIPLWARMTAVADTYDALTSDRPYRKGMPVDKALQIVEEARGTQLCPDCVALFMKCGFHRKIKK